MSGSSQYWSSPKGVRFYYLGMIICIIAWVMTIGIAYLIRDGLIPELDDSYGYLAKASEMENCFLQDCQALVDLEQQLFLPPSGEQTDLLRSRVIHRLFSVYHPLHSALVLILQKTGLTWEQSFWAIYVAGKIFLVIAIAYWLKSLVGPLYTGGALILLSIVNFQGHGVLFIVPSNLSLGIAMLLWGVLARYSYARPVACLILVCLMEAMHPLGRLYAAVGLFVLLVSSTKHEISAHWRFIFLYAGLIALPFAAPLIIKTPFLGIITEPPPLNWDYSVGLRNEISRAVQILDHWLGMGYRLSFIGVTIVVLSISTLSLGVYYLPRQKRSITLSFLIALLGLLVLQFVRMNPHYPGVLFSRVLVPFGILSYALWVACLVQSFQRTFPRQFGTSSDSRIRFQYLLVFTATLILLSIVQYNQTKRLHSTTAIMIDRHRVEPNLAQVDLLKTYLDENKRSESKIIYFGETPLYYYLTHGLWNYETVLINAVIGSSSQSKWLESNQKKPTFVVFPSPLNSLKKLAHQNGIRLKRGDYVDIIHQSQGYNFESFVVREANLDFDDLDVQGIGVDGKVMKEGVQLTEEGRIELSPLSLMQTKGLRISNRGNKVKNIDGFYLMNSGKHQFNWPWNSGLVFQSCYLDRNKRKYSAEFTTNYFEELGLQLSILQDKGATVLSRAVN